VFVGSLALAGSASHPTPPRSAEGCRTTVDSAVQDYMAARRMALLQCHSDTNEGRLPPRDCETEPHTAAAIATAQDSAVARLNGACTDATVTEPPPAGIGAQICGDDGVCGFAFAHLDDGTRGDANDYADCLLCLANDAVDSQIDLAYDGLTTPDPPGDVRRCRLRLAQATVAFDHRRHSLEHRHPTVSPTRLTTAQMKIASRLLTSCRPTPTTIVANPTPPTSPSSPPTAPARTARTP
jgi:hypothetical protein